MPSQPTNSTTRREFLKAGTLASSSILAAAGGEPASAADSTTKSRHSPRTCDVAVIGAGFAGLAAARELNKQGKSVLVVEARDRVGGRVHSHKLPNDEVIDLGAQWVSPKHTRMYELIEEFGLVTFPQYETGEKFLRLVGQTTQFEGTIPRLSVDALVDYQRAIMKMNKTIKDLPLEDMHTVPVAQEWMGQSVESWKQANIKEAETKALLDLAVRAIYAMEPADISLFEFFRYQRANINFPFLSSAKGGAQEARIAGGSQQIADRIVDELGDRLILNFPVLAISQTDNGVEIRSLENSISAKYVIVSLPPTLAGRIHYQPTLPALRDGLTQRMPMGSVIKCIAAYEKPFWRDAGLSGEFYTDSGPVCFVNDDSPDDASTGALVAFIIGNEARHWADRPESERRKAVLNILAEYFGPRAAEPTAYIDKSWANEPWSVGCYTGLLPPGAYPEYLSALRKPIGRIHWAGTETAIEFCGYMEGAIRSGDRAASEVLDRLPT